MKNKEVVLILLVAMLLTACNKVDNERSTRSSLDYEGFDKTDYLEVESSVSTEESEETSTSATGMGVETIIEVPDDADENGGYIIFGHYEQDGDESNGPEPIEWEIVSEEEDRILLVSRYILINQPFNIEHTNVTWETCSLRAWLNEDFYNSAFSELEQEQVLTVTNTNPDNAYWGTDGGNDTEDRVFCLSVEEILDYYNFETWDEAIQYGNCQALSTEVTQYAQDCGAFSSDEGGFWWLRTLGENGCYAVVVDYYGNSGWYYYGNVSDISDELIGGDYVGVRPAIYLSVD